MDRTDDERVFIYVRLRVGARVLARTKIREFGGLGGLLADFLRTLGTEGVDLEGVELAPGTLPVMEYADASNDDTLIAFRVDPERQEQVVEGRIPPGYRRRMLDPRASSFASDRFVERAAPDLPAEQKDELARWLVESRFDLLARIREAMDESGRFEVHLPLASEP
ncbi:MAG: hypothetical protein KIT58_23290 [Planctomycetota bacterium]|nr:hypothetical protein [Planctomycetota bacterium]